MHKSIDILRERMCITGPDHSNYLIILVHLTTHLNELNRSLQGENQLISTMLQATAPLKTNQPTEIMAGSNQGK